MKITHDREKCIGCNICIEHAPKDWKMSDDYKATLIDGKESNGIFSKQLDPKRLSENEKAAEDCPVSAIKIEK